LFRSTNGGRPQAARHRELTVPGRRINLLLTSVGSLVGQNILDVLDYPGLSRRERVRITGTNSLPDAACNFRCDRCYLVPATAAAGYRARMQDILLAEAPDLILCCRDEDTYVLSRLKSEQPELPGVLPVGGPMVALIGFDKWQTSLFARKHSLPFAESFMPGHSGGGAALEAFCRRHGYPLIAKPARGAASRGVCFVRNAADAEAMAQRPEYLFQEYVGDRQNLEAYFASLQGPPPLFAQFSDAGYLVSHTIVAPNGDVGTIVVTENKTLFGHTFLNRRVADSNLDAIAMNYARAFTREGGSGPINVQFRRDRDGNWKAVEINLRTSGVLGRFLMGVDQLSFLINAFVPGASFPEVRPHGADQCEQVGKQYYSYPILGADVADLQSAGVWTRT
jgi:carbamoyl-phosphate synthase large subunit